MHNRLGPLGAGVAHELRQALGAAAYVFLAGWFTIALRLVLRRSWLSWSPRSLAWLSLVPTAAVLAERWPALALPGTMAPLGAGGSIGAWLDDWLQASFQPIGQQILLASCAALGLVLSLDTLLLRLGRLLWWLIRVNLDSNDDAGDRPAPRNRPAPPILRMAAPADVVTPEPNEETDRDLARTEEPADGPHVIPIHHHNELPRHEPQGPHLFSAPRRTPPSPPLKGRAVSDPQRFVDYELPSLNLLEDARPFDHRAHDQQLRDRAALLEKTFTDFGLNVEVVGINTGPVVTQFEIALETGLRVNKVTRLADDIALNLKVPSVRIVAPIPGKNTVGIEVPNESKEKVRFKDLMQLAPPELLNKSDIPLFLGKDASGEPLITDLAAMPHCLIAGTSGSGKSVCINTIIMSMMYLQRPDTVKLILVDPKVVEMAPFKDIPHLMCPVINDAAKATSVLEWACEKMDERYDFLAEAGVRNIKGYNSLTQEELIERFKPDTPEEEAKIPKKLPYIVIIIDELADLMMTSGKEVESYIVRIAQKARAVGIHLILATQRPQATVVTGLIKSNMPSKVAFRVASKMDSRIVLDQNGAALLLGQGDMLFLPPGASKPIRGQGTVIDDKEIKDSVKLVKGLAEAQYEPELVQIKAAGTVDEEAAKDDLFDAAVRVVLETKRGSVSLLQRRLTIGYSRASRLIEAMAAAGIVGSYKGSQAREAMITVEEWDAMQAARQADAEAGMSV
jgi:S-DNA-T family DNA segregation ATPase FtsK/SpoIIIE